MSAHSVPPRLSFLLVALHARARSGVEQQVSGLDVAPKQAASLVCLGEYGPMSQQELGRRIGVDRTTVVAVVDGLEHAGLIERRRNAADRRAYALHLTAEGRRHQRAAADAIDRAEGQLLGPLGAEERDQLLTLLARLVDWEPAE
ncbi:MarR family transcriptional regulator [Actinomadura fulvescens]|uniref:MarR family winged helix-turn-helix transcriptional regulator n=1 Tax=Actinomadura fulvescens TaxID=46160 RepID=UPI0031E3B0B5